MPIDGLTLLEAKRLLRLLIDKAIAENRKFNQEEMVVKHALVAFETYCRYDEDIWRFNQLRMSDRARQAAIQRDLNYQEFLERKDALAAWAADKIAETKIMKVSATSKIDWVEIPAGRFIIGVGENRQNLFLDKFYIGRFPVTNAHMYEFLISNHRYSYKSLYPTDTVSLGKKQTLATEKGNHPADTSWHLAGAFCDWIGARLPTVAEWEKAARSTDGRSSPWGNEWDIRRVTLCVLPTPANPKPRP